MASKESKEVKDKENEIMNARDLQVGDYMIHVYIEETRGLVHPTDPQSATDPVIKLQTFDEKKFTTTKDDRGSGMIYWGEHVFFEKKIDDPKALEFEKLYIQVIDKNLFFDSLIGEIEVDIMQVYSMKDHVLHHQWAALSNFSKTFDEIKGFIKFSVNVVGPNDKQSTLEDESKETVSKEEKFNADDDKEQFMMKNRILLPPQLKTNPFQLEIELYRGEKFVKMDGFTGSIDPYVIFEYGPAKYKTKTIKDNQNPSWGQKILLPYSEPSVTDLLTIKLYDWDFGTPDEIVGSCGIKKSDIINGQYRNVGWINIYGSQLESSSKFSDLMNINPDLGTFWKGRILIAIKSYPCENPKLSCTQLDMKDIQRKSRCDLMEWSIIADVHYGLSFSKEDSKFGLQIRWADAEMNFDKKSPTRGVWEWYERKTLTAQFPYTNSNEIPDVFLYIMDGSKRISFIRQPAKFFMVRMNSPPELYSFKPEKGVDPEMREDKAGILKMKIGLGLAEVMMEPEGGYNTKLPMPKVGNGTLVANIYQAEDLIPADSDGTSDPYLKISYYGRGVKSDVVDNTLNPIWNQKLILPIPVFKLDDAPPIILKLYDEDLVSDDFIGGLTIDIKRGIKDNLISLDPSEDPVPQWLDVRCNPYTTSGRILLSFYIVGESDQVPAKPICLPKEKFFLKVRVLGLRNLKSVGILPVSKAFIKIDLNSLRNKEDRQMLDHQKDITTIPKESGCNPNILTFVTVALNLPTDVAYAPSLSVTVYDSIFKGLMQPVLGVFSIDLKDYISKSREKLKSKIELFENEKRAGRISFVQQAQPIVSASDINLDEEESESKDKIPLIEQGQKKSPSDKAEEENEEIGDQTERKSLRQPPRKSIINPDSVEEIEMSKKDSKKPELKKERIVLGENGHINSQFIIKKAKYEFDKPSGRILETEVPQLSQFISLGYDLPKERVTTDPKRHYRFFIDDPLEDSPFMDKNTFDEFTIFRGKRIEQSSLFQTMLGMLEKPKEMGKFKGWVDIFSEEDNAKWLKLKEKASKEDQDKLRSLSLNKIKGKYVNTKQLDEEFMQKKAVVVRVYVIDASSLAQMDKYSLSDPFLKVRLGDKLYDCVDEYQDDKANCDFHKMFEFKTLIPGESNLEVEVWDYDPLFRNELIGKTHIDLENRFFSKKWRKLSHKPIETREIYQPHSRMSRGRVRLWVDIISPNENLELNTKWFILPQPPKEFELRVVIWDCKDIPMCDIEDTTDIYLTGTVGNETQRTDTHFRSQNGKGSFNYRFVFKVTLPNPDPTINFQVWDKDLFSPNDYIADGTLSYEEEAKQAFELDSNIKIMANSSGEIIDNGFLLARSKHNKYQEKFRVVLTNVTQKNFKAFQSQGSLQASLELVPIELAKASPVGKGRNEPNHDPFLPPPVGRIKWSWNPYTMFCQLVGPAMRAKICCLLCVIILTTLIIFLAPIIFGNIIGNLVSKI